MHNETYYCTEIEKFVTTEHNRHHNGYIEVNIYPYRWDNPDVHVEGYTDWVVVDTPSNRTHVAVTGGYYTYHEDVEEIEPYILRIHVHD